jgi:hypothetical protein
MRTIYVPEDPTIRKAIVVNTKIDAQPHNHSILPPTKASIIIKNMYKACIEAAGIVGSTVRKVDNGM